ncbi:MAG: hypothetical protein CUN48_12970, partial [Candidatus Thermofonsia Clade 3 bacterium]
MYGLSGRTLGQRIDEALAQVGLVERAKDRVKTYSSGMKRRLNIGIGLIHKPQLLGSVTRLSDLRGKTVMLFFGYTHCPDVCPLALSEMRKVKAALGKDAERIAFVFVSVDGTRDTPEVLRRYVRIFDPDFIGLT